MKFSIVTPTYNIERYLEETIQSIAGQTYQDIEHIVVDGGSTDGTLDILRKHPHLHWISEPDNGQSDALNKGFRLATGDILAWQNADDLYFPTTFQQVHDFLVQHPDIDLVYGYYQMIGPGGEHLYDVRPIDWNQWLFQHGRFVPLQPTVFWRRRVYEAVGELDENIRYTMDVDFFARASHQFRFARIPVFLGQFRSHDESKTHNPENQNIVRREYKAVLAKNFGYTPLDSLLFDAFYLRSRLAVRAKALLPSREPGQQTG